MTYTEDREVFERDFFKPPFLARMLGRTKRYVHLLDRIDKDKFLEIALDKFWEMRDQIRGVSGLMEKWEAALHAAATSRAHWHVWCLGPLPGVPPTHREWVEGKDLGRSHAYPVKTHK